MSVTIVRFLFLTLGLSPALAACQKNPEHKPPLNTQAFATLEDSTAAFPRLVFPDGSISVNDRCPVRKTKLNRRMPPIYVNGRPVGFC